MPFEVIGLNRLRVDRYPARRDHDRKPLHECLYLFRRKDSRSDDY